MTEKNKSEDTNIRKKFKTYGKKLEKYDKYTEKKENRLIIKYEEALYIGITASIMVVIIFTLFELLELFLYDFFGISGYLVIILKIFLAIVFLIVYTNHVQMLIMEKEEK